MQANSSDRKRGNAHVQREVRVHVVQSQVAAGFFFLNIPEPFHHVNVHVYVLYWMVGVNTACRQCNYCRPHSTSLNEHSC